MSSRPRPHASSTRRILPPTLTEVWTELSRRPATGPVMTLVAGSLLLAGGACAPALAKGPKNPGESGAPTRPVPPNIVLILSDDQGFGDFSRAGHPALETAHLDRLAAESPVVERFYVSPVCSPTRASLLTGRYNYRTRVVDTWVGRSMMEPDEITLAEVLRSHGFRTGIFGKWHLGDCYPLRPMDQGFDEVLVHRGGGLAQPSEPPANEQRYTDPILFKNGVEVRTDGFCTDVYFDAALNFIARSLEDEQPFFAYVPTNAPHGPFGDVPTELYERALARDLEASLPEDSDRIDREARIIAMVENLDANVGRILAHLDANGAAENTIVVFLNDNGPVWGRYTAGLRGYKTGVYEGGIRTPLFVRWPSRLSPETTVADVGAHIDLFPTLLEAAGIPQPDGNLDGRSFFAQLGGSSERLPERTLFLQSHRGDAPAPEHNFAAIGPRWKLLRASGFGREEPPADHPFELYDLLADPGERDDLAAENSGVVSDMREEYRAWFADVSATRVDNYAPPRIVVGHPSEPCTVLTRQDWRNEDGGGWGSNGIWHLSTENGTTRSARLLFTSPVSVARAVVRTGETEHHFAPETTGSTIELGRLPLPAGDFELRVLAYDEAEDLVSIHQLALAE